MVNDTIVAFITFRGVRGVLGAGVTLLAVLVIAPPASAGPAEDYQAVVADFQRDGNVTQCRFTREQLQNTRANIPFDVALYAPTFVSQVNAEIRRWDRGGCKATLGSLSLSPTVFRAASAGRAFTARSRRPVGTKVSFRLSSGGSIRFTVDRKAKGRRVGGKCRRKTKGNAGKRGCTRWVKVAGSFTVPGNAGANSFGFRGRIGGRKLKPAPYRLNGQATNLAGRTSAIRRKSFRVVE